MDAAGSPRHQPESSAKTAELDAPLHALGFEIEEVSPARLTGRLLVTPTCCQVRVTIAERARACTAREICREALLRFWVRRVWLAAVQGDKVLHGGVSALIAEGLASMGAHMASGYRRVAGMQLSINHFRSAAVGDTVLARAVPVHIGRSTQVWEVKLWKMDPSTQGKGPQIAESRVTLLCNLPVSDELKNAGEALRKYSKL